MAYVDIIRQYTPQNWTGSETAIVSENTEEFRQILFEVHTALSNTSLKIKTLTRVQNIHDLGQFLIRGQLLVTANAPQNYYELRRFVKIPKTYLKPALEYNIDPRRCGLSTLIFNKEVHSFSTASNYLLIVNVLSSNRNTSALEPSNSLEYYIEYVVELH